MKKAKKVCGKKCKGIIVNKDRGVYCQCLENKLPKLNKRSVKAYPTDLIDEYWFKYELYVQTPSEDAILKKLEKFGLSPYEVELLMLRYIEEFPMKTIVLMQGWLSVSSATHYLRATLRKLRAGKFSFR